MTTLTAVRRMGAAATLALLATTFTACGSDDVGDKAAEKAVEKAYGDGADVDVDGDEVTIETSEGTFTSGKGLSGDFPKDVPVIGEVTTTAKVESNFTAITTVDGSPEDAIAEAGDKLTGAGFTADTEAMPIPTMKQFVSDAWRVSVFASPDGDTTTLSYTVESLTE